MATDHKHHTVNPLCKRRLLHIAMGVRHNRTAGTELMGARETEGRTEGEGDAESKTEHLIHIIITRSNTESL